MKLHLNLTDKDNLTTHQQSRPSSNHRSNRLILRKSLDPNIIQSCLDSLDVFKDLLQGLPYQKNRVIRDVCKNIQLSYYDSGDILYDVGHKVQQLYLCIAGKVSICILTQQPKQPPTSSTQLGHIPPKSKPNQGKTQSTLSQNQTYSLSTIPVMNQQPQYDIIQKQISLLQNGQGFGQAQFIAGTKRKLRALIKQNQTLIGKLQIDHFAQVIQNYKQRVYYKKRDMFQKCALFSKLPQNKLQFIINNTKPMTIHISQILAKQGQQINHIYLVNRGQISQWKTGIQIDKQLDTQQQPQQFPNPQTKYKRKTQRNTQRNTPKNNLINQQQLSSILSQQLKSKSLPKICSLFSKHKLEKPSLIPQQIQNKVFMGQMSEGCFIGDMELAMGIPFKFNAICKTQRAELYYCDKRIILSQMTQQDLNQVLSHYKQKQAYLNQKIYKYKTAKQKIQKRRKKDMLPPLTKCQLLLKRKLMHRHTESKPSLIGHSSPRDIQRMIARKQCRVIKQPQNSKYPIFQLFPNYSAKRRSKTPSDRCSFNPLPVVQLKSKKIKTQPSNYQTILHKQPITNQFQQQQQINKFKSMIIQLKPIKTTLKNLGNQRQKNIVDVNRILNKHRHCDSRFRYIADVIQRVEKQQK